LTKIGDALRPNTYWDDGYNHMTDRVDAAWAEKKSWTLRARHIGHFRDVPLSGKQSPVLSLPRQRTRPNRGRL
jgi:hypothetical protein